VRGVIQDGRLVNISGNPYHPYNMAFEGIDYDTPVKASLAEQSPVCGKSLDTPNHTYSPYRILKPLKRNGPRGSGRFAPIEWEQLITEIAEGGQLFAHLGEQRHIEGLKDLNSDDPVDPAAPELGPKRNAFVQMTGRLQAGRKQFIDRFVKSAMGSKNRIGHTDICGLGFRMGNWTLTEKQQVELKADPKSAEYILIFGANIYEALQPGVNTYGALVARRSAKGKVRFSIVDPRATNASAHASHWIPVKPGQDGALAMGIARWIIENDRHNKDFLAAPNPEAARAKGYAAHANGSYLVVCAPGRADDGQFLRWGQIDTAAGGNAEAAVVLSPENGRPACADSATDARLDAAATITAAGGNTVFVKTAFRLMKESVMERTLSEYAETAGVDPAQVKQVAEEFSAYGTRAAVTQYHGAGNYASGTYAAYAVAALNALVGSVDMRGGYMKSGGGAGTYKTGHYDLSNFAGDRKPSGTAISREKFAYEDTTEYRHKKAATGSGYPAKRPWFPFSKGGLSVEGLSGIDQQYPYACKILFTYLFNPVYSIPGGYRFAQTLQDPEKLPLFVSMDTAINETNIYADYIVPELSYAEGHYGWLTPHAPTLRFTGIRTPMIEPLTAKTKDGRPICTETFFVDLAEKIGLPGFGKNAIADAGGRRHPLRRAEDFYLRGYANIALNAGVPPASAEDIAFVEANYPVAEHRHILPEAQWHRVCYMLARGGVFTPYESVFDGQRFKHGIGRVAVYNEELAATRNALTGERFSGTLTFMPPVDAAGRPMAAMESDYPFTIVTYKKNLHTQSRSLWCQYAMEVMPENFVQLNSTDAASLGVADGDRVRLISPSNPDGISGRVQTTGLIRPGCVGVSFHYGHSQFGASRLYIEAAEEIFQGGRTVTDAQGLVPNPAFSAGLNPNKVAFLDPSMADTPLVDVIGGIPDFSSTRVKVVRI
jgi:tetrathionate reductase subunit A